MEEELIAFFSGHHAVARAIDVVLILCLLLFLALIIMDKGKIKYYLLLLIVNGLWFGYSIMDKVYTKELSIAISGWDALDGSGLVTTDGDGVLVMSCRYGLPRTGVFCAGVYDSDGREYPAAEKDITVSCEGKIEIGAYAQKQSGHGLNVTVQTTDEYGDSDAEITLNSKKYRLKKTVPVKIRISK